MTAGRFAIHGHFYQPSRRDPFTGQPLPEPAAAPYRDWTSRITDESYAPNAQLGNFGRIGWDIGPTLARELRLEHPDLHALISSQEDGRNGMGQGYHHAILPLSSLRDRRTEIRWGLRDFELRYGHRPAGLWLPETAVDLTTLRICAEQGVRYTILAPWQGAGPELDTRHPHRVEVGGGRSIIVCFYDRVLSTALSFEPHETADADRFTNERILPRVRDAAATPDGAPLVLLATDGELYGHHHDFRDLFLSRLTTSPLPDGVERASLGRLLDGTTAADVPIARIVERTSWSCHHGVARWSAECPDAPDGRWKGPLRGAFDRLAGGVDALALQLARSLKLDLWAARDGYVDVVSGFAEADDWVTGWLGDNAPERSAILGPLLRAQEARLSMFVSDAWYWDDPSRPETAQAMRFAALAARTMDELAGSFLEAQLVEDLRPLRSPLTGQDGAALYREALRSVGQPPPR